jgi:uncharacterized RDD family membrane protein YckC
MSELKTQTPDSRQGVIVPATSPAPRVSLQGNYAGFVSRVVAFVVDGLVIVGTAMAATAGISLGLSLPFVRGALGFWAQRFPDLVLFGRDVILPTVLAVALIVWTAGYHVFFTVTTGQTIGKRLMGLRVVRTDGRRISATRALVRTVGYLFSAVIFFLGFIWILIDDRRQAWHDKLAATYVIYAWDAHFEERFLAGAIDQLTSARRKAQSR